jgi:hypothetical protein
MLHVGPQGAGAVLNGKCVVGTFVGSDKSWEWKRGGMPGFCGVSRSALSVNSGYPVTVGEAGLVPITQSLVSAMQVSRVGA